MVPRCRRRRRGRRLWRAVGAPRRAEAGEASVAGAAGHRDECKRRYELICSRMKAELARVYVEQTEELDAALHRFVSMQAQHSAYTAAAWDKVREEGS
eukprot:4196677-Pyramimonas_sp.AAC.1